MPQYRELINIRWLSATVRLSVASGLMWALIAWFIGYRVFGSQIWGGLSMAPLIGVVIGRLSWPLHNKPRWVQIVGALFFLYVAAACFAISMALFSSVLGASDVRFSATLMGHVSGVLWGLTFGGCALVLWPLAFFNHRLVWQANAGWVPPPPEVRTTSSAIKALAVRIMGLSILGYVIWALFLAVLAAIGSSRSPMPWWVVTGLLGWTRWFVLGVFVWLLAPVLAFGATLAAGSEERSTATYGKLIGILGFAVFAFPILSFAATLVVTATKISIVQSWATEGFVFWAPYFYRNVLRMYLPWFLVGTGMIVARQLVGRA